MLRRLVLTALLSLPFAGAAMAQCDTRIQLVNQSGHTIAQFFFSASSEGAWGEDRLGDEVLANGETKIFDTGAPGAHDFRVVLDGGNNADVRNINICAASAIVATPTGIVAR